MKDFGGPPQQVIQYKADPQLSDIMRCAAKAEMLDQMFMLLDEMIAVEDAIVKLRKSTSKDKYTRQVELEERLRLVRGLINRMRERRLR